MSWRYSGVFLALTFQNRVYFGVYFKSKLLFSQLKIVWGKSLIRKTQLIVSYSYWGHAICLYRCWETFKLGPLPKLEDIPNLGNISKLEDVPELRNIPKLRDNLQLGFILQLVYISQLVYPTTSTWVYPTTWVYSQLGYIPNSLTTYQFSRFTCTTTPWSWGIFCLNFCTNWGKTVFVGKFWRYGDVVVVL